MLRKPLPVLSSAGLLAALALTVASLTGDVSGTPLGSSPAASQASKARFAVIGDYGYAGQPEADVADLVKGWNPDFIITTGDNNYPDGASATIDANIGQYYHQFIYPYTGSYGAGAIQNLFFPSLGNHDWTTPGAQPYLDYFALPSSERYYDFAWGPVHLFAIDSDPNEADGTSSTSTQASWLQAGLTASTEPWDLVYMHHPPYSSGPHGSTSRTQWPYQSWGADAVLAGHDHTYERLVVNDFPYFVVGLGGRSIYSFGSPVSGSQVRFNADYGAMLVDASPDQITFKFFSRAGALIDSYGIQSPAVGGIARLPDAARPPTVSDSPSTDHGLPTILVVLGATAIAVVTVAWYWGRRPSS